MKKVIIAICLALHLPCFASIGPIAYPQAITSDGGKFVFTIVPGETGPGSNGADGSVHKDAYGICYEVQADASLKEVWRVEGWFTSFYHLFLNFDGSLLTRVGSTFDQNSSEPLKSLGIAFYSKGKLINKYTIGELLKDGSKWNPKQSWLRYHPRFLRNGERHLELITTEGIRITFDYSSGTIVSENNEVKKVE